MIDEIWKDIPGLEAYYQASNKGDIKSVDRYIKVTRKGVTYNMIQKGKKLKQILHYDGYLTVTLAYPDHRKKIIPVHRIIAKTFLSNHNNLPCVNHKDENKTNNFVWVNPDGTVDESKSNLEWCTRKYNDNYGTRNNRISKSKCKKVNQYDKRTGLFLKTFDSVKSIEESGICSHSCVSACLTGRQKTAGGYIWRFV